MQRIDVHEMHYWIRMLRIPRTARKISSSVLKEIKQGIPDHDVKYRD